MSETSIAKLPGEGEVQTITRMRCRRECEECGEPAIYKWTYLLKNYRANPASAAYRHDDCRYCEDHSVFTCATCKPPRLPEYDSGLGQYTANERFALLFLYWKVV